MTSDISTLEHPAVNPLAALSGVTAPDEATLNAGPASMLRMAQTFTIESDEDYRLAADELRAIKAKHKALEERRTTITGPLNKAMKAVNDLFRGPMAALEQAESVYKTGMLGYNAAKERIAAEEHRKAEALAQAERDRLAAEARAIQQAADDEARRIAAIEAQRAADAAAESARLAKIAADAAAAGNAEAARIAEEAAAMQRKAAAEAAAIADAERNSARQAAELEVAAVQNVAAVIVAPTATTQAVKVQGVSTAKSFDFEVTDLLALVRHIAEHPEHISLVVPDNVRLRGLVRSLGLNTNLPGVRVFAKTTVRAA